MDKSSGVTVLRAYASEDSLLKLVKVAAPPLAISGVAGVACWVVASQNDTECSMICAEGEQQLQAGQDSIGHVPPLAAAVVEIAAYNISQWLVHDVLGLWQPRMGDLEVVPLSGRIRQKLPKRTMQDLELSELGSEETIVVEGLHEGAVQVQKWVKRGLNPSVQDAVRMAKEEYGPDVAILEPSDASSELLMRLVKESILAFGELMDRRYGGGRHAVLAETLAWLHDKSPGVVFVDAEAPTGLRFAYTRQPAAQGGGRVVTCRVARATQRTAGGEALYVGGVTRLLSVVLERGTAYGQPETEEEQERLVGFLASTAAHEITHLMCRHTSENAYFHSQRRLVQLVRLAANAFLRPAVRKVTSAALGIRAMPAAGCGTPAMLSMLVPAYLEAGYNPATADQALKVGAPIMELAQQGTSDIGFFARRLIHELEAEQGAMLLLARMGHSPAVMLRKRGSVTEHIVEQGDGDINEGMEKLHAMLASQLRVSMQDAVLQWPDAPKVAWALAQVFFEAQATYLDNVQKRQART
ncbi:hypothetical protein N2152v2_007938 [Parachlorella kessleri]